MKNYEKNVAEKNKACDLLIEFKESENPGNDSIDSLLPEIKGMEEIEKVLNNTEAYFYIKESEFYDVVTVDLYSNPILAIEEFKKTPTIAIKKVIPLDLVVPSLKENIIRDVLNLASIKIKNNESFTVKCEIRNKRYIKSKEQLIYQIIDEICNKLKYNYDEKNPHWTIIIEEFGKNTGIGINKTQNIFINQ